MGNLRLNYNLYNSNPHLLVLLTLLSCALLVDVSVAMWIIMPPSIMIMFILLCIQYINFRYWWASLSVVLLFTVMLGPDFPRLANHGNLALFICFGIILLYGRRILTKKALSPDTLSKCFRYSLVAIYFIAGIHKLNAGFFSISGSCSAYVTQGLNLLLFDKKVIYPDYIVRILQIGTIGIEMVVPFGILFQRTRYHTVWILILFHLYLSLCGFSNFSAFALFLITGSVINFNENRLSKNLKQGLSFYIIVVIVSSLIAYFLKRLELSTRQTMLTVNGLILNIGIIYFCIKSFQKKQVSSLSYHKVAVLPYVCILILSIWGLQSYTGLSNTSTLTMFSNLVTEKTRSNHYIVNTAKTKLYNFEEDFITIIELPENNKKWGRRYKIENYDLPVLEFRKLAAEWVKEANGQKVTCKILYRGQIIHITDLSNSKFSKPEWWHKFIYYRRIPKKGINECMW